MAPRKALQDESICDQRSALMICTVGPYGLLPIVEGSHGAAHGTADAGGFLRLLAVLQAEEGEELIPLRRATPNASVWRGKLRHKRGDRMECVLGMKLRSYQAYK